MTIKHGVYAEQTPTGILPPKETFAGLPVVIGAAPVHLSDNDPADWSVNKIEMVNTYKDAVERLGYLGVWTHYTLCEFIYSHFVLFGVAPVVLINIFDPARHKTAATAEAKTFDADDLIILDHPGLVADPVVKNSAGDVTYALGIDYTVDWPTGRIMRVEGGAIAAGAEVKTDYSYGDPSKIVAADIIGGLDAAGKRAGLELVEEVFPKTGNVPGLICAPGWSGDPGVVAAMSAKANNVNGLFSGFALVDIPVEGAGAVTKYSDAAQYKNLNNLTDEKMIVCWPKVALGDNIFHMSTQLAGLINQVDAGNDGIPSESPSNKSFQIDSAVAGSGGEINLTATEANDLNAAGIVTALNFSGWKCWGNYTGAWPGSSDVKDTMIPIQRMFVWEGNNIILSFWGSIDNPLNRRLIQTLVDSENIRLSSLKAGGHILGGRVEINEDENPVTDIMSGKVTIHLYMTPPAPAQEILWRLEYDPEYLAGLFG